MGEQHPEEHVPEHRGPEHVEPESMMRNKTYDRLKFLALIGFPALGSAYFSLGDLWDLPKVMEVVGTISIVDTLLGAFLGISSSKYVDPREGKVIGFADVTSVPGGKKQISLEFPGDPSEEFDKNEKVTFKVRHK